MITSFVVPTGEVLWDLGSTRTSADFARHIGQVACHFRHASGFDWVVDNLNTHWSMEVCEWIAAFSDVSFNPWEPRTGRQRRAFLSDSAHRHVFHFTPKHGSWLNQVELWFSVLSRRFLRRGDFTGVVEFAQRPAVFLEEYNRCHALPFVGRTRVNGWCVGRLGPRDAEGSSMGEPGSAGVRAGSGFSIRLGPTSVELLNWRRTCEMVI